jgi:hypothetical protein
MSKLAQPSALDIVWSNYGKTCLRNERTNASLIAVDSEPARTSPVAIVDWLRRGHDVSILIAAVGRFGR